ncbi:MAG TPA: hypothetical protein VFH87_02815 [Candidatus Udaeobacter sp.]|jgi:hypothetical protein|nr:hypothetical protein [Candidatus Udaeobacter sp.]
MATPEKGARGVARAKKRSRKRRAKTLPRIYGDPFQKFFEEIGLPDSRVKNESAQNIALFALGYFQELAARVKQCCSDKKASDVEKVIASAVLVHTAIDATTLVNNLAREFDMPFRQVAEESNRFPCVFPAHRDSLRALQDLMWNHFNLGKRFPLKLRSAPGRKTFSQRTWVNRLLIRYIFKAYDKFTIPLVARLDFPNISEYEGPPLTQENVKHYLNEIWQLLLRDIPEPEKHPRLRQLGGQGCSGGTMVALR